MTRWRLGAGLTLLIVLTTILTYGTAGAGPSKPETITPADLLVAQDNSETINFGPSVFYTTTVSIPTYPYASYLSDNYNATFNMTYPVLDWVAYDASGPSASPKDYELLVLENAYLRVTMLPALGGRVYQFIDKTTGHNHLYQNPVIKPTHWGPPEQGWWLAVGGIEWALPVEEHGYEWGIPWDWDVITSTAGVTVTVQDTHATDRLRTTIAIYLPTDQAALSISPHLENPTDKTIDYKFWSNAALSPGPENRPMAGFEFMFDAHTMTVHSTGDGRLPRPTYGQPTGPDYQFSWPVHEGVDYAKLNNWREWLGFFEYPQANNDFVGLYNHDADVGMVRVFPHEIARGTKGFAFGWGDTALPWQLWTDEESGGVEIHGGVAPTFWDFARLEAKSKITWEEWWVPVREVGRVSNVTEQAALTAREEAGSFHITVQQTQARVPGDGSVIVWDRGTCTQLAQWQLLETSPLTPTEMITPTGGRALEQIAIAYVDGDGDVLVDFQEDGCLTTASPDPHLGYGINVRDPSRIDDLFAPLGLEWIKLWEEYNGMPTERLPYHVLYVLDCRGYLNDMNAWRAHLDQVALAGQGRIDAYEICNEPNVIGFWNNQTPDPARFAEMLCIANERIKAINPDALVISGGLAPVGRIVGSINGWEGHNGNAMDERTYLQAMLDNGAGLCMDGFGYHPYGFAYAPELAPDSVSNGFVFRGSEVMHDILLEAGYLDMPVWATEFNWLRDPEEDGRLCDSDPTFMQYFDWMKVSAQEQAAYLTRAFAYADRHWPWMQGMFAWNMDWHNYKPEFPCEASRFYSIRRDDGSTLGAITPAYNAMNTLNKRSAIFFAPHLTIEPSRRTLLVELTDLQVLTTSFVISNAGSSTLTWTASIVPGSLFTPTLPVTQGVQGDPLWVTVDPSALPMADYPGTLTILWAGTFTSTINVSAIPTNTQDTPQQIQLILRVVPNLERVFLPLTLRDYQATQPEGEYTPHGPSKIGTHAIADGGTVDFVQQVKAGGAHVAVVKAVNDLGYLAQVKQISPETITIGRWADPHYESLVGLPDIDVQGTAQEYMAEHMERWAPHKAYVDYWEILNEDDSTLEGHVTIAEFFIACMDIAEVNGYKLALFSYSVGVPEWYEWEAMVETGVFARAKQGGHILSLHEYGWPMMQDGWGEPIPLYDGQPQDEQPRFPNRGIYTGRYRHLYEDFLIPRDEVIPLVITEVNLGITDPEERAQYFLDEIAWYDDRLREDDYVIGMNIFTLGGFSGWEHFDFQEFLPDLADRIIALKDE